MTDLNDSSEISLIALGANQQSRSGDPRATLERALALLAARPGIAVRAVSRWFRSPAFPPGSGPDFVNGAAALATALGPEAVLAALHDIEARLGRVRAVRWDPRTCDLDLLAQGTAVRPDAATVQAWMDLAPERASRETPDRLLLPHPRLHQRAFVLAPLADIAPGWRHPLTDMAVEDMLAALPAAERAGVTPV